MTALTPSAALAPRAIALDLLQAVLRRRRPFDEALADHPELTRLAGRDRAFVRQLVATTLRRLGQIDRILGRCLERPLPRRAAAIQDLLRLGTCQLLFLRTPPHAAVDSTVALVAKRGGEAGFKGLVNAVLRRLGREGEALLSAEADVRANTPDWLWESWTQAFGEATAAAIAAAHLEEPPLDITAKGDPAPWAERLDAVPLPTGSLRRATAGPVEALPGFDEGAWWVQDAAAALPAQFLGPVAGKRVIDLCAAPGGKTAQLAAAGAQVTAVDRSANRLARLTENLSRLGLAAETVTADAAAWRPETPADAVLLDAPCSATGTIRRHPDVPWLKNSDDLRKLVPLQDRLLAAAVAMTAPGGTLVYCVCSLQPEEGPERIAALLASDAAVERSPIGSAEVGGLTELLAPQGELRSLPCHLPDRGGLAGFYAARLRRR